MIRELDWNARCAMIISVKMYMEQWAIWIIVDVVTVIMWGVAFANGNESMATLLMWIVVYTLE